MIFGVYLLIRKRAVLRYISAISMAVGIIPNFKQKSTKKTNKKNSNAENAKSAENKYKFNHEDTKAQRRIRHDNRIYRDFIFASRCGLGSGFVDASIIRVAWCV